MKKLTYKQSVGVAVAIAVIGLLLFGGNILNMFVPNTQSASPAADNTNNMNINTGVDVQDIKAGTGQAAQAGDTLTVHYVGTLTDGKVFDSSLDRNQPFTFVLGANQVIKGWDQGLVGMKEGGVRKLTIAPDFGYGAQSVGTIPPNSTLVFQVQLLKVAKKQ